MNDARRRSRWSWCNSCINKGMMKLLMVLRELRQVRYQKRSWEVAEDLQIQNFDISVSISIVLVNELKVSS